MTDEFTIEHFLRSGSWRKMQETIESILFKCPEFDGDEILAAELGRLIGTLEGAFQDYWNKNHE